MKYESEALYYIYTREKSSFENPGSKKSQKILASTETSCLKFFDFERNPPSLFKNVSHYGILKKDIYNFPKFVERIHSYTGSNWSFSNFFNAL